MNPPIRMTLTTGNKQRGFTFVEVMVAMIILSSGIVAVYRSFFLCVDYLNNIASRWWANELMEEKIYDVTRRLQESKGQFLDAGVPTQVVTINHRPIFFQYSVELTPLPSLEGMFQVDVALSWNDGKRPMHLDRSIFILK